MSRSQSRRDPRLEHARADNQRLEDLALSFARSSVGRKRSERLEDAYEDGLITIWELDLAESVRPGYLDLRARAEARFAARVATLQCSVCRDFVYANGRCRSCYIFQRKHKRDRTPEEVVKRNRRAFDRAAIQEERRAARRMLLERDH
jgi:hypothetical protein